MITSSFLSEAPDMKKIMRPMSWMLVFYAAFSPATTVLARERSAEQILKELDAIQVPTVEATKRNDETYLRVFLPKHAQVWSTRDALILELYKAAPAHQRIPKLIAERWWHRIGAFPKMKEVDEISQGTATRNSRSKEPTSRLSPRSA